MNPPLIVLFCAIALFCTVGIIAFFFGKRDLYTRRISPLTDTENYFYFILRDIVPQDCVIIPQAPIISCFDTKHRDRAALNKIISKRFDFAIAIPVTDKNYPYKKLVTVAAIELDDVSHDRPERKERDRFVDALCYEHGLPLLRYKTITGANPDYDVKSIKQDIDAVLKSFYRK